MDRFISNPILLYIYNNTYSTCKKCNRNKKCKYLSKNKCKDIYDCSLNSNYYCCRICSIYNLNDSSIKNNTCNSCTKMFYTGSKYFNNIKINTFIKNNESHECCICLGDIINKKKHIKLNCCNNLIHIRCIRLYIRNRYKLCPLCRT